MTTRPGISKIPFQRKTPDSVAMTSIIAILITMEVLI
jgi:hypothetical protein